MKTRSLLAALFGLTLITASTVSAHADPVPDASDPGLPPATVSEETSAPQDTTVPESPRSEVPESPRSEVPEFPRSEVPESPRSEVSEHTLLGSISVQASTISEDAPVPGAVLEVTGCEGGPTNTLVTRDDGYTSVSALTLGCYTVMLTATPSGYQTVTPGPHTVALTADSPRAQVGFHFQPVMGIETGTVVVDARSESAGTPVAGVYATIESCHGQRLVGEVTTGPDGQASASASLGCYVVRAVGLPADSALVSASVSRVELTAPGQVAVAHFVIGRAEPPTDSVRGRIVKQDRITGALLPGAVFEVFTCGGEFVEQVSIPAGGQQNLTLVPGCYRAVETVAPVGYVAGEPLWFRVDPGRYFTVSVLNLAADQQPVFRNPDQRHRLQSVPSGSIVAG